MGGELGFLEFDKPKDCGECVFLESVYDFDDNTEYLIHL